MKVDIRVEVRWSDGHPNINGEPFNPHSTLPLAPTGMPNNGILSLTYGGSGLCNIFLDTEGERGYKTITVSAHELAAAANAILDIAKGQGYYK